MLKSKYETDCPRGCNTVEECQEKGSPCLQSTQGQGITREQFDLLWLTPRFTMPLAPFRHKVIDICAVVKEIVWDVLSELSTSATARSEDARDD